MTERSLQVTYRKGRPFAAYLYLETTPGQRSARTDASPDGLLVVDYGPVRTAAERLIVGARGRLRRRVRQFPREGRSRRS